MKAATVKKISPLTQFVVLLASLLSMVLLPSFDQLFAQEEQDILVEEAEHKLIYLDSKLLSDILAKENVTTFIGLNYKVEGGEFPADEDTQKLNYETSEVKLNYSNDKHALVASFAPVDEEILKKDLVLTLNHSLAGKVEVFRRIDKQAWEKVGITGSEVGFNERLIPGFELAIPLDLSADQNVTYLMRRKSKHRFDAKAFVMSQQAYSLEQSTLRNYYFFYWGAFIALLVYNTFLFIATKEKDYFFYLIFGMAIHVTVLAMTGFLDYLLAPLGVTGSQNLILFSSSSLMSSMYFAYRYNNLGIYSPRGLKLMKVIGAFTLYIFLAALGPWEDFFGGAKLGTIIDILLPAGILTMIGTAFVALRKGHTLARFYLTSWLFMFIGALIYFGHYTSLIPRNFITSHGVMWGNLLEMLIVSWGLAYKVSILDREKEEAFIKAKGKQEYERLVRVLLHDIANPLNLIQYYADLNFRNPQLFREKEGKAWEKINLGISKIREIITFHRKQEMNLSKNFRSIDIEEVPLKKALEHCESVFEEVLDKKKITLLIDDCEGLKVFAERVSLTNEVFSNLVSNAIKFSYEGGQVTVNVEEKGKFVHVIIRDQGRGMEKENIKAFIDNKGIKSELGTQGEEGTGYGLYLVKSYMNLYGGQVLVESTPKDTHPTSHGTSFTLIFKKA